MERQGHDYATASAMAYAQQQRQAANMQQQQQFGFHPQHQQFPSSMHGSPFIPPGPGPAHPPMQQFPYHPALQQQQQPLPQLHPHAPPPLFFTYHSFKVRAIFHCILNKLVNSLV